MNDHFNLITAELRKASAVWPHGTYTKLAKRLGVTPQHVRRVALGLSTSRRVARAIEREYQLLQRERVA